MIDLFIDGMDFSGKSTIAKAIAESQGDNFYEVRTNRLTKINPVYNFASKFNKSRTTADDGLEKVVAHLFMASMIYDLENYQDNGQHIIQDSASITRSIAYHTAYENEDLRKELSVLLKKFPMPKKSIYLYASVDERLKRLATRIKNNPEKVTPTDYLVRDDIRRFNIMEETLRNISCQHFNAQVIDTSARTEQSVVEEVKDLL